MVEVIDSDIDACGFSLRTAYYLAYASKWAYAEADGWVQELGLQRNIELFTCGQFHGFVGRLENVVVLAFRGTKNVKNCLTDAETPLVRHPPYPGRVHRGFAEAVEQVWPDVRRLLGTPSQKLSVWITGHSLGGAMATLASIRLASEGHAVRAVYTYGSPRVGNRLFRDAYPLVENYRFVNDNDLVPHLPFLWCYKHVGQLKLFDNEGNLQEERHHWEAKKQALAGTAKRIQQAHLRANHAHHALGEFDWLADHHLGGYLDAIKRILPRVPRRQRVDPPDVPACHVPTHWHRPESPLPKVPPPGSRRQDMLSEADFIAAFCNQPR